MGFGTSYSFYNFTLSTFAGTKKLLLCICGVVKMFQMLAAVSLSFIFISITSFCLKTHPAMRVSTVSVHHQTSFGHRHNVSGIDLTATALTVSKQRDEAHPETRLTRPSSTWTRSVTPGSLSRWLSDSWQVLVRASCCAHHTISSMWQLRCLST